MDAAMLVILPAVVLALLLILFRFLGFRWHAITVSVIMYLLFGAFIASAQVSSFGGCQPWRVDGYWWPIVDWPGDIYQNVWSGDVSARRYLLPRTCEVAPAG